MSEVRDKAILAKKTTTRLGTLSTRQKNNALQLMADALLENEEAIIAANEKDLQNGREQGLSSAMLDRLALNAERIAAMAEGLQEIIELPDPVGDLLAEYHRPNGLRIMEVRVPIGLIGIIYEARPNVTVDAAGLCLKSGNAVLLRGGSSALHSNAKIVAILQEALQQSDIPADALQLVTDTDRASVTELIQLSGIVDLVIPRGGHALIQNVLTNATVPVIETGAGVCHTYIDADADPDMASDIAFNAKVQRPSVCNAMETLLVHKDFAKKHLKTLAERLRKADVDLKGSPDANAIIGGLAESSEEDWHTEYNDIILDIKVVDSIDEAIEHIATYGTKHSEAIVTENSEHAERFLLEVDAAAVFHNASTRFTDGFEFGFGAEIGISTQKLHARGPMGLPALTSTKYRIYGDGQIRE